MEFCLPFEEVIEMKAAKESEELKRFIAESKKETERMISLRRMGAPPPVSLGLPNLQAFSKG